MLDNPIIYQVGGVLLFVVFCVLTFLVTKVWRATHIVFGFLTFLAAIGFVSMAALSHKTNLHWRKQYSQLEKQLEAAKQQSARLTYGEMIQDESGKRPETVMSARGNLNRVMLDRGRLWRNCTPGEVAGNAITLSTVPPGVDAASSPPNRIDVNMVMYAFKEAPTEDGYKVPNFYLGEFKVDAATDTSVTLSATLNLMPDQQAQARARDTTWVLYEMMPIDGHQIFAEDPTRDVYLEPVEGQPVFGAMNEEQLRGLFQGLPPNIIDEYVRDGLKPHQDDPPENVYIKVEFLKKYEVDVDSSTSQGGLNSDYFDSQGRAAVDRLRRGEPTLNADGTLTYTPDPVVFEKNDVAVFTQETADQLIDSEICKPIEPIFVRSLRDFDVEFQNFWSRYIDRSEDIAEMTRNLAAITDAKTRNEAQVQVRKQEQAKLVSDKTQFLNEAARAKDYLAKLEQKRSEVRGLMSALYRSNAQLAAQFATHQKDMAKEINRRAAAAATAN